MAGPRNSTYRKLYEIGPCVGQGAFGRVFVAREPASGVQLALKILGPEARAVPEVFQRFQREARILRSLDHRHIVGLYGSGLEEDPPWIAMEFVRGEDLEAVVYKQGPLGPEALTRLAFQLSEAVDGFHERGVLHRDLKPANIRIRAGDGRAMVMDLGLGSLEGATRLTRQGQILGTLRYMPPDCSDGQEWTKAADLYQLGAILFEAGAGTPLLPGSDFHTAARNLCHHVRSPWPEDSPIPPELRRAIDRLVSPLPEERYGSGAEFRAAVEAGAPPVADPDASVVDIEPPPLAPGVLEFLHPDTVVEVSGWGSRGVAWRIHPWRVVLALALVAGLLYGFLRSAS